MFHNSWLAELSYSQFERQEDVWSIIRKKKVSGKYVLNIKKLRIWTLLTFSCTVVSNSLWPRGLQHARLSRPSPTPRACSNSCLSSRCCHPTFSSSVVPYSSCLQSGALVLWIAVSHQPPSCSLSFTKTLSVVQWLGVPRLEHFLACSSHPIVC